MDEAVSQLNIEILSIYQRLYSF